MSQPQHRVDAVPGDRHVRVEIGGRVVAETDRPVVVTETGLPARFYVPVEDVDFTFLEPTGLSTHCPFKGDARYWSFVDRDTGETRENAVWGYPEPLEDVALIKDCVAFYDEAATITVSRN
ncbi:DUF427 domain-containing protein [Streptomyces thermolineatus]|uniref:DUF427 domain-containing protein n=1 Tax=Streptomyces thermolineatus TaxID=44033 RepID=A0ABN3MT05_9ACTN